eukprot:TRINITY_DN26_c1_g1_i1.p1 TRINITY_DN26_c1_g1~~TRINITY_DN26_c1_g1_i1.p1  ORF type:complete len:511 (+),score=179.21 TRINITY_DN26_c1_g1_i1:66-1535(+)
MDEPLRFPEPSAPPLPSVWGGGVEPLFEDAEKQGPPPIGTEVILRAVVVAHKSDGTVLVEMQGGAGRVAVLPQGLSSASGELQRSSHGGVEMIRVPPEPPGTESPECCDQSQWRKAGSYSIAARVSLYGLFSMFSWAATLSSFVVATVLLCFIIGVPLFRSAAVLWRWLAHRHLDLLLEVSPPPQGVVLSHPSARIPGAGFREYFCSGHTWSCLFYLLFVSFPISLFTFVLTLTLFPMSLGLLVLFIGIPMFTASAATVRCLGATMRQIAVCMIAERMQDDGAWLLLNSEKPGGPPSPEPAPRAARSSPPASLPEVPAMPDRRPERAPPAAAATKWEDNDATLGWVPDAEEVVEIFAEYSHAPQPPPGKQTQAPEQEPPEAAAPVPSHFLVDRDRSSDEDGALARFRCAWAKTCGSADPCRLQDIVIAPPKEPGMGPRHFIRVANEVDYQLRLKLVKGYKAMFSSMYVHIVDADEQRMHYGADFSDSYA